MKQILLFVLDRADVSIATLRLSRKLGNTSNWPEKPVDMELLQSVMAKNRTGVDKVLADLGSGKSQPATGIP